MLKKTITYVDFNGVERQDDFYFNLSKAEVAELELSTKGGLAESLKELVASDDGALIVAKFKEIILMAYGQKSDDGRRFIKSDDLVTEFTQSNAYSELFMLLATNAEAAAEFMNGVVPQDINAGVPQDHLEKANPAIAAGVVQSPSGRARDLDAEYAEWLAKKEANKDA
jgi:hypothetical protein